MIAHVEGTLAEKALDHVVVDVGGVGLRVYVSLPTLSTAGALGVRLRLRTYLQVREDALILYGFATDEERAAFELLIGVQQIGPKLAMAILSALEPAELASAVRAGDHARLQRIPGIGKKTAERLVLELRDKLDRAGLTGGAQASPPRASSTNEVASALINLGYKPAEAERAADDAAKKNAGASVEQLLKKALRALAE